MVCEDDTDWNLLNGRAATIWPKLRKIGQTLSARRCAHKIENELRKIKGIEIHLIDVAAVAAIYPNGGHRDPSIDWDATIARVEWADDLEGLHVAIDEHTIHIPRKNGAAKLKSDAGKERLINKIDGLTNGVGDNEYVPPGEPTIDWSHTPLRLAKISSSKIF